MRTANKFHISWLYRRKILRYVQLGNTLTVWKLAEVCRAFLRHVSLFFFFLSKLDCIKEYMRHVSHTSSGLIPIFFLSLMLPIFYYERFQTYQKVRLFTEYRTIYNSTVVNFLLYWFHHFSMHVGRTFPSYSQITTTKKNGKTWRKVSCVLN